MKIVKNESGEAAGFIEYVPGEFAWRTVDAKGYMFIHCLQVSRNKTGFGYGRILLQECIEDSKGTNGIVIVTSRKPWVNDKAFFLKHGFKVIQKAPPYFEMVVKQFKEAKLPSFIDKWEERAAKYGDGVTVIYSDQCPFIDNAIQSIYEAGIECGVTVKFEKIESYEQAQNAPSPYGTFHIIVNGKFITHRLFNKERYVAIIRDSLSYTGKCQFI
ncbi:GNAT family acetyltransferase [Paenibacillus sp. 32O-W]|jgi:N-acetylglutamate synthase and related acetyltransferases|uniref:N-acetyltransferase n=1 Tax=Paenibacillus cisolokensis TaxID=1658519 RepID=A0ABQ4N6W5_9BACL|nr:MULTISPECIES: GNAT family N-acetyltransferase [Paenibacillus]ALS26604.1 GNAT family acetyltransferase [Paenibacillus sp. 32O-W]GIQ63897.1 N-acetyltransferase [Paenibacillus cisolokensis]